MSIKRLSAVFIVIVFCMSIPCFSQTKNRVVIADGDKIKLFEFNVDTKEFDLVWKSLETGSGIKEGTRGIRGMALKDTDNDGKNELVAIDQFGLFVWGKNGRIPIYYNLKNAISQNNNSYVIPMDLDGDNIDEYITQRTPRIGPGRKITAWQVNGSELKKISEIELPGGMSWSLRSGDCDNDTTMDILTSSNLIHVLGWDEAEVFFEKTSFPNISNLVDVVHIADVDGDGTNEIVASGNSGCFTVYKARKQRDGKFTYPVVYQSEQLVEERGHFTQGLEIADIDGDGDKEVLVGVTSRPNEKSDNIFVYEYAGGEVTPGVTYMKLDKTFSMPLEGSDIPGFYIGDADNDGLNEVIYNGKYVLKFSRDTENNLECTILATLGDMRTSALVGPFEPKGQENIHASRIVPQYLYMDLKSGDTIESGKTYKFWIKLNSPWSEAQNVRISLESLTDKINVKNREIVFPQMDAGKIYDNESDPFLVTPEDISQETQFELKVNITGENEYYLTQNYSMVRSSIKGNIMLEAVPQFVITSDTLAISSEETAFKDLGISYNYFSDYYGMKWPPVDILLKYKYLLSRADHFATTGFQLEKLIAYLDAGGHCLIYGDNVVEIREGNTRIPEESQNLIPEYFKTRYVKDFEGERTVEGKSGDPISAGLKVQLRESQYGEIPDVLESLSGAIPILFYPSSEVAGVRIEGKYKMVYLGFSLDDIQQPEVKKELVQRILDWFDQK
ncbi:FG-GAP repeat domain-containing protein [Acidobacteriota bacterium]